MAFTLRHTTSLTMTTGQLLASESCTLLLFISTVYGLFGEIIIASEDVSHMTRLQRCIQSKIEGGMGSRFSEKSVCAASMSFSASSLFLLPSLSWVCRSTLRQYTVISTDKLLPWCIVMAYSVFAAADGRQVRDEATTVPAQKMIGHC